MKDYLDIVKRCKEQNIDIDGCHIYIYPNNFDGEFCHKGTLSQDGEWLCIPLKKFDESFEMDYFEPVCYQVRTSFKTYLKGDSIWYLVECFVLYDNN